MTALAHRALESSRSAMHLIAVRFPGHGFDPPTPLMGSDKFAPSAPTMTAVKTRGLSFTFRPFVASVLFAYQPVDGAESQNGRGKREKFVGCDGIDVDHDKFPHHGQHGNNEHRSQPNDALLARQHHE